jgi:hypothetical protein
MITDHEKKTIDTCIDSLAESLKSRPPQQREEALHEIVEYWLSSFEKLIDLLPNQAEAQKSGLSILEKAYTAVGITVGGESLLAALQHIIDRTAEGSEERTLIVMAWFEMLETMSKSYVDRFGKLLEGIMPPFQQDGVPQEGRDTLTDEERTQAHLGILRARDSIRARTPEKSMERYNGLYDLVDLIVEKALELRHEADNNYPNT